MLLRMLKGIVKRSNAAPATPSNQEDAHAKAEAFVLQGDLRSAIGELRKHLEKFPNDVAAINNLGCHLSDVGDIDSASKYFELAYSLDDSFLPGIINHAKHLNETRRSSESLSFLREAKTREQGMGSGHIDAVYAGMALNHGDAVVASRHALRARLASFDNLRFANCFLLYCAYDDLNEEDLAAEHKFWGETLAPLNPIDSAIKIDISDYAAPSPKRDKVFRIGYWSPDFRNHSVRYFFRPLLENHDRAKFEVFLYHDGVKSDAQTELMRKSADLFFDVSNCPDSKLTALIQSHKLDFLIEVAGHTSSNRLPLLQQQLATVQISALAYPPTTGMSTIDAKIVDTIICDSNSSKFYTEEPLPLPSSFWCFDPYDEAPISAQPPVEKNGYITFACVGNIAKISQRITSCWVTILQQVPTSKLLIRSISFEDDAATATFRDKMLSAGISFERLMLLKPAGGDAFFASYNEIDIILDTYPFNGGTTTCFATYMGVPVVSLAGKSLISRMGKSVLTNLGMPDWAVDSYDAYIAKAVSASSDPEFLRYFRANARALFQKTALGNGAIFAQDFEHACMALLENKSNTTHKRLTNVPDLPPQELIRRAYSVLRTGQHDASQRIVDYCLRVYPNYGSAHILFTQQMTSKGKYTDAAHYLMERLERFDASERVAALINVTRNYMLSADFVTARETINSIENARITDQIDASQIELLRSALVATKGAAIQLRDYGVTANPKKINVVIASDAEKYSDIATGIKDVCAVPDNFSVNYVHCPENKKGKGLSTALYNSEADIVVWVNKNVSICNSHFFSEITLAIEKYHVVGFSGATTYDRLDWRQCEAPKRICSNLSPSAQKNGCFEVEVIGQQREIISSEMAILDGSIFAFSRSRVGAHDKFEFDPFLESAATMLEEDFTVQCHAAGMKMAVHNGLGVLVDWRIPLLNTHIGEARWLTMQKFQFEPFANLPEDRTIISAPVESLEIGVKTQRIFFGDHING